MKCLFDQNISYRILRSLPDKFADSTHVKTAGLTNASDIQIWEFAKKHNFTIITQDSDFNDLTSLYGFPPKIIWIRTGNLTTQAILNILIEYDKEIENFINDITYGCFEIISIRKK